MILKNIDALRNYIDRCFANVANDYKNDFIGAQVSPETEHALKREMSAAGFHEFIQDEAQWPSLYLSVDDFKNSPYYQNIDFGTIKDGKAAFEKRWIPGNQLFNVEAIVDDPQQELNDSMTLRALDKPYEASVLTIDGDIWMLDVYSEAFTIDPCAKKANGKVAALGLGIGYFVYMAMLNPAVESITVIEKDPLIIRLFNEYLAVQFPQKIPLVIIEKDAETWFTKEKVQDFDYVFVDTYQSSDDGYQTMEALCESYVPEVDRVDFWIEDSCIEFLRALIIVFFHQYLEGKATRHQNPNYHRIMKKIAQYFKSDALVIDSEKTLKKILYDRQTLREIIGTKVL